MKAAACLLALSALVATPNGANAQRGWSKMTHKHCAGSKLGYVPYTSLKKAEDACGRNTRCSGVYDLSCDNSGIFYLCTAGKKFANSARSCVYKNNHHRKPGGRWIKITRKHCAFHRNTTGFATLQQAERACLTNHTCSAVYDQSCDGRGLFYTCKRGFAYAKSAKSCVYTRSRGTGTQHCSARSFLTACANDKSLNSGNPEKLCAGTCSKFLGKHKRQCVSSPPPGTPKQTVRYLVKMLRMCHKHHGHHHKGGKGGRGGRKRGGGK